MKCRYLVKGLGTAVLGGVGYPVMEIIWRGRTHPSMALAGACSLCWMRLCARMQCTHFLRALMGCAGVTALEGTIGMLCNRDHKIWDYRGKRGHIRGQVCPQYALLWFLLSYAATFRKRM
ncbi:MAG: hypothetical protein IKT57_05370 [Clostridia bacterium]|nr:hypothetical protein [Clostridia bacterium]